MSFLLRTITSCIGLHNLSKCRMMSTGIVKRLESKAAAAEQMIIVLKSQVEEYKRIKNDSAPVDRVRKLALENQLLRSEIERYKNELTRLETLRGITQIVPVAADTTNVDSTTPKRAESRSTDGPAIEEKLKNKERNVKTKTKSKTEKEAVNGDESIIHVGRLDFRVGRIVNAMKHPDADSLYVEEIDVGEDKNRTVVSGLAKHVPVDELQDRMVVLLCNLKPSKMRGVTSEAMVMCAFTPEKVEILVPPAAASPGDLVFVEGYPRIPDNILNPKKKIFDICAADLTTNDERQAVYKGQPLHVPGKGAIVAPTLTGAPVK